MTAATMTLAQAVRIGSHDRMTVTAASKWEIRRCSACVGQPWQLWALGADGLVLISFHAREFDAVVARDRLCRSKGWRTA